MRRRRGDAGRSGIEPGRPYPFHGRLALAGALSLLAWGILQWLSPPAVLPWTPTMRRASETMAAALDATGRYCREHDIPLDPLLDPAGTCLVGPQVTALFTTLGQLAAKRTTLSPDLAGLLARLLQEAGVQPGDVVAVGASGSFPGLLVATLSAAEALEAIPVPILSLGASSYGATRPEFHLLDIHHLLNREGILNTPPAAVSLGGGGDVGREFPPDLRDSLTRQVEDLGIPFLEEDSLPVNVARRMEIYCGRGGTEGPGVGAAPAPLGSSSPGERVCPVAVFVNIGGAQANLGPSPEILEVPSGLSLDLSSRVDLPPARERGVLFEMAARRIPVIHLLHVRGLALNHGLPWDPVSLSRTGSIRLEKGGTSGGLLFWLLTGAYLLGLGLVLLPGFSTRRTVRRRPSSRSFNEMS